MLVKLRKKPKRKSQKKIFNTKYSKQVKTLVDEFKARYKENVSKAEKKPEDKPVRKMPKYYPTEGPPRRNRKRTSKATPTRKLRPSITPGTILILLTGSQRGKRVVFLKQMETGLLLVTGPYKYNGVPLRRVSQRYVIATKTKIDISGVKVPEKLNDVYFRAKKTRKTKKGDGDIFEKTDEKYKPSEERLEDQKKVDNQLAPIIRKTQFLKGYLCTKFALQRGQYPHDLVF